MTEQPNPTITTSKTRPTSRVGRLPLMVAVALVAVIVAIAIGVIAVTQLRTGPETTETVPATPDDPDAWRDLDPLIERQPRDRASPR